MSLLLANKSANVILYDRVSNELKIVPLIKVTTISLRIHKVTDTIWAKIVLILDTECFLKEQP